MKHVTDLSTGGLKRRLVKARETLVSSRALITDLREREEGQIKLNHDMQRQIAEIRDELELREGE